MGYAALVIPTVGPCQLRTITDVSQVRDLIEGNLEMLPLQAPVGERHYAWVNEDGLRLGLDPNPRMSVLAGRMIVGTAVCWRHDGSPDEADVAGAFVDFVEAMVHL